MLTKIDSWVKTCASSHVVCNSAVLVVRHRPGRLLKLDGKVRLVSPTEVVRFAALSYCWGLYEQPKTTKDNLWQRTDSFDIAKLPQTLLDAIFVARGLGLSYIWIDSLCIVQDDPQDWATESAKMADIYSGAYVVLAATHASDVSQGFLQPRKGPISISTRSSRNHAISVEARRVNNHDRYGLMTDGCLYMDNLPLSQRGWSMQERLLGTRVVHFLLDEVCFECKMESHCECGLVVRHRYRLTTWPPLGMSELSEAPDKDPDGFHFSSEWAYLAEEFSVRYLKFPEDALPALSGIAQRTQGIHAGKYIAGLWERGFVWQLSWTVVETPVGPEKSEVITRPSFSWITATRKVEYDFGQWATPPRLTCVLMMAETSPSTVDPFGRIAHAKVVLRGPVLTGTEFIRSCTREWLDDVYPWLYLDAGLHYPTRSNLSLCSTRSTQFEGLESALDWDLVLCLGLFEGVTVTRSREESAVLLLVRRVPDRDEYERVGVIWWMRKEWFSKRAVEHTVTLI